MECVEAFRADRDIKFDVNPARLTVWKFGLRRRGQGRAQTAAATNVDMRDTSGIAADQNTGGPLPLIHQPEIQPPPESPSTRAVACQNQAVRLKKRIVRATMAVSSSPPTLHFIVPSEAGRLNAR